MSVERSQLGRALATRQCQRRHFFLLFLKILPELQINQGSVGGLNSRLALRWLQSLKRPESLQIDCFEGEYGPGGWFGVAVTVFGNGVCHINEAKLRRAQLVL